MSLIFTQRSGLGEPLLLVHGVGGELHMWEPVSEQLSAQRSVIAVDLPGFGQSAPLAEGAEPSPARLAQALGELLDELGLPKAHVAGNSLGAWIALELAKQGRALSVTALCPAGLWSAPLLAPEAPARNLTRRAALRLLPLLHRLVATAAGRRLVLARFVAHPELLSRAQALRLMSAFVDAPAYEVTNAAMRRRHFEGFERIRVPVTVAWAERDRLVRPAATPPGVRVVRLPGCGHIPTWDDPDLVARVLLEGSAVLDRPAVGPSG